MQDGSWGEGQVATGLDTGAAMFDFKMKFKRAANDDDAGLLGIVSAQSLNASAGNPSFIWIAGHGDLDLNFRQQDAGEDITSSTASGGGWDVAAQVREFDGNAPGAWSSIALSGTNWNPATPFDPNWVTFNAIRHAEATAIDDINVVVPEPGTLALLSLGLIALARRKR